MQSVVNPWDWQPSRAGWCESLRGPISAWTPHRALDVDRAAARDVLCAAARREASWLFHPFSHALFAPTSSLKNDLQLVTWISFNTALPLGTVATDAPVWIWSSSGGRVLPPGRHDIAQLARAMGEDDYKLPIALDVWFECTTPEGSLDLGFDDQRLWRNCEGQPDDTSGAIENDVVRFLRVLTLLCDGMSAWARWLAAVTRVVVPLVPSLSASFNSSSLANLPGLVFSDMKDEAQIMEALVHESAHHHFRIAEAGRPIILPDHQDTYASPLRPEPRPLRGVFLAYHALAYICAFFASAQAIGLGLMHRAELAQLREKSADAERTLGAAAAHLTPAGREFFERTREVAAYGR